MNKILIINAGSSSIKWTLFSNNLEQEAKGIAQRIKMKQGSLLLNFNGQKFEENLSLPSFLETVKQLVKQWEEKEVIEKYSDISNLAFRIVNGGPHLQETCLVTEQNINFLKEAIDLAPVHNPGAIEAILAFKQIFKNAKMSLHFDTSFHKTLDKVAYTYPLDINLCNKYNIRKYGFHGLNHHYITQKMESILNKKNVNIISLHIGNGASLCAIKNSKSIDTSMGFTPLAGVMMGTRSGDIDPSIIPYIMKHENLAISEVMEILNEKSGLLGISDYSSDMRDIRERKHNDEKCQFAYDLYISKIVDYLVKYINKIGNNIDAIVFTAGVAENNYDVRESIISGINIVNLKLDQKLNTDDYYQDFKLISSSDSDMPIYVVKANEEIYIANEVKELFK